MVSAFSRLLIISLITILWACIAIIGLRWLGLRQEFTELDHPLLKNTPLVVAPAATDTSRHADILVQLDLRRAADNRWLVSPAARFTDGERSVSIRELTFEQLQVKGFPVQSLEEALRTRPEAGLWIDIHETDPRFTDDVIAWLDSTNRTERLVVCSPVARTLLYVKSKRPRWLYCAPPTDVARATFMSSVFLETVSPLKADLVVFSLREAPPSERLLREIRRRRLKILVKTDEPARVSETVFAPFVDGLMTTRPTQAFDYFQLRR